MQRRTFLQSAKMRRHFAQCPRCPKVSAGGVFLQGLPARVGSAKVSVMICPPFCESSAIEGHVGGRTVAPAGTFSITPGRLDVSLNLSRNFFVWENHRLQFRWEVFNAINHPNFALPANAVNAPNAATFTSAGNGRLMQFGLRYSF
jgi:hypothetical protein